MFLQYYIFTGTEIVSTLESVLIKHENNEVLRGGSRCIILIVDVVHSKIVVLVPIYWLIETIAGNATTKPHNIREGILE